MVLHIRPKQCASASRSPDPQIRGTKRDLDCKGNVDSITHKAIAQVNNRSKDSSGTNLRDLIERMSRHRMQNLDPMWREGYRRWRAGGANGARKEPKAKDCHVAASMPRSKSVQPKISWPEAGSIPDADDQALALHFERKECLSTSMAPRSAGDQTQPQPKVQPQISWPEAGSFLGADEQAMVLHFEPKLCLSASRPPRATSDQTQPKAKVCMEFGKTACRARHLLQ
jgi:hypothetical protein